jgi:hypothetical protein
VGPSRQRLKEKEKRRGGSGLTREAAWAEKSRGAFVFFSFLFSKLLFKPFSTLIQFKPFQTFLKNFIDFLETTQATKNHAGQLMMHIHLLSLSLLNYI